jgi:hypothetical protein
METWLTSRKQVIKTNFFSFSFHCKHKNQNRNLERKERVLERRRRGEDEEDLEQGSMRGSLRLGLVASPWIIS